METRILHKWDSTSIYLRLFVSSDFFRHETVALRHKKTSTDAKRELPNTAYIYNKEEGDRFDNLSELVSKRRCLSFAMLKIVAL